MKHVTWLGMSDARQITPEDLMKAGVEIKESLVFPRLQAVEVNNEIAKALLEGGHQFGRFGEVDAKTAEKSEDDQLDFSKIEAKSDPEPAKGESLNTPQTGIDSPTARRTGRASTANQ